MLYPGQPCFTTTIHFCLHSVWKVVNPWTCSKIGHSKYCSNVSWLQVHIWARQYDFFVLCTLQLQDSVLETVLNSCKQWWPKCQCECKIWYTAVIGDHRRRWRKPNFSSKNSPKFQVVHVTLQWPCSGEKMWWLFQHSHIWPRWAIRESNTWLSPLPSRNEQGLLVDTRLVSEHFQPDTIVLAYKEWWFTHKLIMMFINDISFWDCDKIFW